jgi:uncharacterized protein (TIGR00290 family)
MNFAFEAVQRRSPRGVSVAIKKLLKTLERHGPRQISNLLTLMVKNESKMIWHQLPRDVIALQAEAMEIPIIQKKTTWGMFEDNIKSAMRSLKREDAEGMVWGIRPPDEALLDDSKKLGDYVHLRAEKEWVFKVCGDLGVEPILPLWEKSPEQVLTELMEKGFEVLVVVVNPDYFGDEWLGRRIDESFLTLIRRLHRDEGVPVGGDDYHTLVVDGPLFKKRLHILESKTVIKNGYQILDVTKAELVAKS